jgi:hypothetical protein
VSTGKTLRILACTLITSAVFCAAGHAQKSAEIDWDRTLDNTDTIVSILAILIGAAWAYIKFFRGRTFMPRLETGVSARVVPGDAKTHIVAKVLLKNVGLSRVDIHQEGTALRLGGYKGDMTGTKAAAVDWISLRAFSIFERHRWIESGETICDEIMVFVPDAGYTAFRLEMRIVGSLYRFDPELGPEPGRFTWREACIISAQAAPEPAPAS